MEQLPTLMSWFTELPKTCLGEPLKWGVRRIAEMCILWSFSFGLIIFAVMVGGYRYVPIEAVLGVLPVFLFAIANLICSVLLFHGTIHDSPSHMRPWLWISTITCAVLMLAEVAAILATAFFPFIAAFLLPAVALVSIYCVITKYCCQVVYALTLEMEGGEVRPSPVFA